jgi:hypothetical protein
MMTGYHHSVNHEFSPPSQGGARGGNSPLEGSPTLVGRGVHPPKANAEEVNLFKNVTNLISFHCSAVKRYVAVLCSAPILILSRQQSSQSRRLGAEHRDEIERISSYPLLPTQMLRKASRRGIFTEDQQCT